MCQHRVACYMTREARRKGRAVCDKKAVKTFTSVNVKNKISVFIKCWKHAVRDTRSRFEGTVML